MASRIGKCDFGVCRVAHSGRDMAFDVLCVGSAYRYRETWGPREGDKLVVISVDGYSFVRDSPCGRVRDVMPLRLFNVAVEAGNYQIVSVDARRVA